MTKSIERAQRRVELQNFEARKRLLEYDDVMNQQREVIYDLRLFGLEGGEDLKGEAWEMIERSVIEVVETVIEPGSHADEWDLAALRERMLLDYFLVASFLPTDSLAAAEIPWKDTDELMDAVLDFVHEAYHEKIDTFGDNWERILSFIVLSVIDEKWKGHLYDLDHLRESIRYRAYGQRDPLVEYKREAYAAFVELMQDLRKSLSNLLFRAQVEMRPALRPQQISSMSGPSELAGTGSGASAVAGPASASGTPRRAAAESTPGMAATGVASAALKEPTAKPTQQVLRPEAPLQGGEEVGRNEPCPCGSGKKYKKCHGALG
ncbi:MAG: SEC-C metal-binding domain-containing protein [Gemmatimonadales bacterium]